MYSNAVRYIPSSQRLLWPIICLLSWAFGWISAKADGATEVELRRQCISYLPPTVNDKVE